MHHHRGLQLLLRRLNAVHDLAQTLQHVLLLRRRGSCEPHSPCAGFGGPALCLSTLSGLYNSRSTFSHVRPFLSSFCENTHCLTLKQQRKAGEGQKLHISPLCTTQTRHYDRQSHAAFYILEDVVVWSRRSFRIVPSFVSTLMLLSEN